MLIFAFKVSGNEVAVGNMKEGWGLSQGDYLRFYPEAGILYFHSVVKI